VTCRHCNQKFVLPMQGRRHQPCEFAKEHQPAFLFKDNDLKTKLWFPVGREQQFRTQVRRDSDFLRSVGVMDYSLLVGVWNVRARLSAKQAPQLPEAAEAAALRPTSRMEAGAWHGAGAYFLGVVDILQEWTWWKQLEWFWKIWVCRYNSEGVSAIPPAPYAKRFQEHVCAIVSSIPPPPPPSLMSVQCPGERSLLDGLSPCDGEGLNEAYSSDLIGEAEHIMPLHASQTDMGV
jgi:1-phosphatidylinositol-4-phosphate 5-kinase